MNQIHTDAVVLHAQTGARGEVVEGGFRPRVRWDDNGRICRHDVEELRVIAEPIPGAWDRMIDEAITKRKEN